MSWSGFIKVEHRASGWGLDAKTFRQFAKASWDACGEFWHEKILPGHFEVSASRKYHYKRRNKKYEQKKERKWGHRKPLVWSGKMEATLTRSAQISATSKGVRVKLPNVKYIYAYDAGEPNKAEEVIRMSYRDQRRIANVFGEAMQKEIDAAERTQSRMQQTLTRAGTSAGG
jgi:uncharacterized membrane protein